ncbi:MAG: hypothetical protein HYS80_00355 [Candidatus Aenigmarchaeota archaeon]|nr:hypothetical protein [Candidatus Aenigmarchaeota archaeon]
MRLTALQQVTLWELSQSLDREKLPPQRIPESDRQLTPEYWLERCVKEYGLGNHPYVKELYENRFGRPVPQQYSKNNL